MRKPSLSDRYSDSDHPLSDISHFSPEPRNSVASWPFHRPQAAPTHDMGYPSPTPQSGSAMLLKPMPRGLLADPRYSSGAITSALITALLLGALVAIGILQCVSAISPQPSPDGYSALPLTGNVL